MPDGEDTAEVTIADATSLGYGAGAQTKVRVDATPPAGLKVTGMPSSSVLNDAPYHLVAQATDGSGTTRSSGIKSLVLGIDGYEIPGGQSGSCEPGPCTATGEWTLNGEEFGAGKHKIELVATDNAGNKETKIYEITIRHASPMGAGPGSVDPITGTLTLGASDVSIGGGFGALGLSRSYNSRQLAAGAEGPLGPQWSLSLSGEQGVESEPTGDVTLVAEDGSRTTFTSDGKGGFISPKGDENLVLSAELEGATVKAYLLKDPAKGTTVKFIHPSGASGKNLWVIEKAEGALSKETGEKLTYKWEVLEGIERPKEALAPAPAGVSCEPEPKFLTELKIGCRALSFTYATETKATGESPTEWGAYKNRLSQVSFTAYNPATKVMVTIPVAEYAYDKQGRLRAEWDPRISPTPLKTTYGYDSGGRVVAVNPPGQEPWLLHYGTIASDPSAGRLLSAIRPAASTGLGSGAAPGNESKPTLSTTTPTIGTTLSVSSNGSWTGSPLAYGYQWMDCDSKGEKCNAIAGAVNESYTPQARDAGYTLVVTVTGLNADGAGTASTMSSSAIALPAPKFSLKFGGFGEGAAQLKNPTGVAIDSTGKVWVVDHNNNRLDVFSAEGTFVESIGWGVANGESKLQTCTSSCRAGIAGSGSGQFSLPDGLATTGEDVYVADAGNNRIQELNTKGEFVRSFGSKGSEPGQLQTPVAIAVAQAGNVWIADRGNNRVDEFTEAGSPIGSFGAAGTGNGQFKEPSGVAFSGEYAYVVDAGNSRVQQLTLSGSYVGQFGGVGAGPGQFSKPAEIATEPVSGDLFVADNGNSRVQEFNPAGTFVSSVGSSGEGEGQFKGVEGIAVTASGRMYAADLGNNRVQKFTPAYSTSSPAPAPPSVGSNAVTTVEYGVPVVGTGAPYALGKEEVEKGWAQKDLPSEATAVYPPDEPMGWPAKDYTRATVWYFDSYGRTVNVASPSGGVSASEYNETNNVVRTLSAANRAQALKEGAKSAEVSKLLDTQSTYNAEGTQLSSTLGPQHKVKLASGEEKQARDHVHDYYDEGAPGGETYDLLTKSTDGAEYEGKEADVRTTLYSYSGQSNLGWLLRKPTSVTTDPGGLELVHTNVYDPASGSVLETKSPGAAVAAVFALQFGSEGTGNGQFKGAKRVAIDSAGHLWVTDAGNNRVQEFSSTGEYMGQFGSEGTGNGQFKAPHGIAIDSGGHLWVVDKGNNRVQKFSSTGEYMGQFGSEGTGNGRFKTPEGLAIDSAGQLWVTDGGNGRVQEFSSTGEYMRQFGSQGTGNGQFQWPVGIAIDSSGHLWVSDILNNRVQEFSSTGEYMRRFGSNGTGNGQFQQPDGIAIDSAGHLWVSDKANSRVQEFSSTGEYMGQFGSVGGQLQGAGDVAIDSGGDLWVTEKANGVQEWVPHASRAIYSSTFGSEGTGNGRFKTPDSVAIDSAGHVWVTDAANGRVQEFSATGEYMRQFGSQGTGNGQFQWPVGIAIDSAGHIWVSDILNNRVQEFSSTGEYMRRFGSNGTGNGQFKEAYGVAIDSAGHLWVTDKGNNRVQEFSSTGEYMSQFGSGGTGNGQFKASNGVAIDSAGHLWVVDKGNNRVQEFSSTGEYMSQFGSEGTGNGQFKTPNGVGVDSAGHLWVTDAGNGRVQEFSSTGDYMGRVGSEGTGNGQFKGLDGVAIDSGGHLWVADRGNNRVQAFVLVSKNAHESQTIYYSSGANTQVPACGGHPEWANLPCRSQPAIQPSEGVALPIVTDTYNMWDEPETVTEEFGSTTRTKKSIYDNAGRLTGSEVTSTLGMALPKVSDEYSPETGAMVKQSTTVSEKIQMITSVYNKLGQLTEYTDADNNKSSYVYDVDGRVQEMSDGKGTQTYAYDPTTGALTKLQDSAAKMFTASYDIAGRMASETYPNGMSAKYAYDEAGEVTHVEYVKEAHCAGTCPEVWFSEAVAYSIHGEALSRTSTLAGEAYTYDKAGRLTQVQETPTGKGCITRLYAYDIDSSRLSSTTREPDSEGKCATSGGTVEGHTYDEADRPTDTGTSYDAFGNTTVLPAADAEGHEIKSTYYVSNQTQSTNQNGKTIIYSLDPNARSREITTEEGATKTTLVNHYPGPSGAVAWSSEGGEKYTRNIPGIDGALCATEQNGQTPILQLHDLQGNIVATASLSETETKLLSTYNSTEFGVPTTSSPPPYSWLGASGLKTEFSTGTTASGGTGYVPQLGRALQTQPIDPPGSAPTGTWASGPYTGPSESWTGQSGAAWGAESTMREAARQKKAAEEACEADPSPETCPGGTIVDPGAMLSLRMSKLVINFLNYGNQALGEFLSSKLGKLGEFLPIFVSLFKDDAEILAKDLEGCVNAIEGTTAETRKYARCRVYLNLWNDFWPTSWGAEICWPNIYKSKGRITKVTWPSKYCIKP